MKYLSNLNVRRLVHSLIQAPLRPQRRALHRRAGQPQAAGLLGHGGALLLGLQVGHQLGHQPARLLGVQVARLLGHVHQGINLST